MVIIVSENVGKCIIIKNCEECPYFGKLYVESIETSLCGCTKSHIYVDEVGKQRNQLWKLCPLEEVFE